MAFDTASVFFTTVSLATGLIWLVLKYMERTYRFWERRGIPAKAGSFPFGSSMGYTREVEFQAKFQQEMYNEFSDKTYFGFYAGSIPFIMLRDPEYIRIVMAKEFSHFRDRQGVKLLPDDHLSHHLFNLEGDQWRALRVKMSPIFTSGKLKGMFPLFIKCTQNLSGLLLSTMDKQFDVKETTARFSTDVICSCAFGWDVNCIENEDNKVRKIGKEFMKFKFPWTTRLKLALIKYFSVFNESTFPRFASKDIEEFMINAVKDTLETRKKNGSNRNDFIDLLRQLKDKGILNEEGLNEEELKEKNIEPVELTDELMTAQCFVFFIAGFETSSSVQSFCLYELSLHPEVQERLHAEIDEILAKHGDITYQAVQEMEYLDMVVNETMRKYPTLTMLQRRCTKELTFPDGTKIEKGDRFLIPLWSIHRDPQHFPQPEKFDPERFSKLNRDSIKPFTFMPFGEGPRICIGSRFGMLQTKMGILTFVKKYKISPTESALKELEYSGESPILTRTKGPILLNVEKRI